MKVIKKQSMQKQQGVALVMALIMLLLITIVGVASVRMSSNDTQISGNSMFSLMVFQGAESALGKVASITDKSNIKAAAFRATTPIDIPPTYFNNPIETVNDGVALNSEATMIYERNINGVYGALPSSTGVKGTGIPYQIYRVTAESKLSTTSAKAIHVQGIADPNATPD